MSENKITDRPQLNLEINGTKNPEEQFMHITLRPVLKQLHPKLSAYFNAEKHLDFELLNGSNYKLKENYISNFILKNGTLKNTLIGMVISAFTAEELEYYLTEKRALNKRISGMLITRVLSTFEKD